MEEAVTLVLIGGLDYRLTKYIKEKILKLITEVLVFDTYSGSNIEFNKISVRLSITFCSLTHTLNEEEIQK